MRVEETVRSVVGSSSSSASEEAASELQQHSEPLADDDDGITRCSCEYIWTKLIVHRHRLNGKSRLRDPTS